MIHVYPAWSKHGHCVSQDARHVMESCSLREKQMLTTWYNVMSNVMQKRLKCDVNLKNTEMKFSF